MSKRKSFNFFFVFLVIPLVEIAVLIKNDFEWRGEWSSLVLIENHFSSMKSQFFPLVLALCTTIS